MRGGDCLCCSRVKVCAETSVQRILSSYTCALFSPVPEPVYIARLQVMMTLGEAVAAAAMMERLPEPTGEEQE